MSISSRRRFISNPLFSCLCLYICILHEKLVFKPRRRLSLTGVKVPFTDVKVSAPEDSHHQQPFVGLTGANVSFAKKTKMRS